MGEKLEIFGTQLVFVEKVKNIVDGIWFWGAIFDKSGHNSTFWRFSNKNFENFGHINFLHRFFSNFIVYCQKPLMRLAVAKNDRIWHHDPRN